MRKNQAAAEVPIPLQQPVQDALRLPEPGFERRELVLRDVLRDLPGADLPGPVDGTSPEEKLRQPPVVLLGGRGQPFVHLRGLTAHLVDEVDEVLAVAVVLGQHPANRVPVRPRRKPEQFGEHRVAVARLDPGRSDTGRCRAGAAGGRRRPESRLEPTSTGAASAGTAAAGTTTVGTTGSDAGFSRSRRNSGMPGPPKRSPTSATCAVGRRQQAGAYCSAVAPSRNRVGRPGVPGCGSCRQCGLGRPWQCELVANVVGPAAPRALSALLTNDSKATR
jgi:hypothetical protein